MRTFEEYIILFFIFSILGWLMKTTLKYIQFHRFINRGFLIGPYCPIYGFGTVAITAIINHFFPVIAMTWSGTFLMGAIVCGALEYFTSFILEKCFNARWWDYSTKPYNIHGRVWLGNIILFGLASMFIVKVIDPIYFDFIARFNDFTLEIVSLVIVTLMMFDCALSYVVLNHVKIYINKSELDNTEEISKEVLNLLKNHNFLHRRLRNAYPNLKVRPKKLVKEIKEAKKKLRRLRHDLRKSINLANRELIDTIHDEYNKAVDLFIEKRNKYKI